MCTPCFVSTASSPAPANEPAITSNTVSALSTVGWSHDWLLTAIQAHLDLVLVVALQDGTERAVQEREEDGVDGGRLLVLALHQQELCLQRHSPTDHINTKADPRSGDLPEGAHGEDVEALAVGGGGADEGPRHEAGARAASEDDVVRDAGEDGLPIDHQIPVADRDPGSHRHLKAESCFFLMEEALFAPDQHVRCAFMDGEERWEARGTASYHLTRAGGRTSGDAWPCSPADIFSALPCESTRRNSGCTAASCHGAAHMHCPRRRRRG
ncbi:hypothetical protein B296_00047297 [Ensete ventricosum]|uniref:Uncharacterized protein n=1 Tax=Ensete ventricosum TaxID=4639 RepID=A0A426Y1C8_ENSVE|nr:hypothetical protein B296_00047297 [Ensete ventricosum]